MRFEIQRAFQVLDSFSAFVEDIVFNGPLQEQVGGFTFDFDARG